MNETEVLREKLGIELITAVKRRDDPGLERILTQAGLDLNYQDASGRTALFVAAQQRLITVADILFNAGASSLIQSSSKFGPLQMFAVRGWCALLAGALHREADPNTVDGLGYSLLMHAADGAEPEAVSLLLEQGARADFEQPYGLNTAGHLAAGSGCIASLELLLAAAAPLQSQNAYGATPLHFAARNGGPDACRWLIERGADVNARTLHGYTSLMLAVLGDDSETVQTLLDHGADIADKSYGGTTIDQIAARSGPEVRHACASWRARNALAASARRSRDVRFNTNCS